MGRKFKISEAQYNLINGLLMEDGENFTAIPNDPADTKDVARNLASNSNTDDATISLGTAKQIQNDPSLATGVSESYMINKKQIKESRRRFIDENTKYFNYSDFVKEIKNK